MRIRQDPPGEQSLPEGVAGFIVIATQVKFDHIVPVNDFIDRTKFSDSPLNLPLEQFNSSIDLGAFHSCDDVRDLMIVREIFEFVLSRFPIPG